MVCERLPQEIKHHRFEYEASVFYGSSKERPSAFITRHLHVFIFATSNLIHREANRIIGTIIYNFRYTSAPQIMCSRIGLYTFSLFFLHDESLLDDLQKTL
jgi:hypothetical protein